MMHPSVKKRAKVSYIFGVIFISLTLRITDPCAVGICLHFVLTWKKIRGCDETISSYTLRMEDFLTDFLLATNYIITEIGIFYTQSLLQA